MTDVVTISGGLGAADAAFATVAGRQIDRVQGEPLEAFQERVLDVARNAGERFAVFGGLPDTDAANEDQAAIDGIVKQAEGLADAILSARVPCIDEYWALRGLSRLAAGSGLFALPPRCIDALNRMPPPADMAAWQVREDRMAALL